MTTSNTPKTCLALVLAALCTTQLAGCNDGQKTTGDLSKNGGNLLAGSSDNSDNRTKAQSESEELYLGQDWDKSAARNTTAAPPSNSGGTSGGGGAKNAAKSKTGSSGQSTGAPRVDESPRQATAAASSTWSLVLSTFTEGDHAAAAQQMVANLQKIAPQVSGARVHTTSNGSMVVYGNYTGRDDPRAKTDQDRLKAIKYQGHTVFNRVLLSRLDLRMNQGQLSPYDLLSARKAHPKTDPLYTLEVAIWETNDDPKAGPKFPYEEVRRAAEAYAKELRARNYEAYFYHDDENKRSEVTVGLFDRRAINPKSGFFSDEVTALYKQFPVRMANGETMYEPIAVREKQDESRAKIGAKPQSPVLVLVPMM